MGEVVGLAIGIALRLSSVATIVLAVTLGFVFGFGLGLLPLLKAKFLLKDAIRQILIAEGLSIAVMETAEVLVEVYTLELWQPASRVGCSGEVCFWR